MQLNGPRQPTQLTNAAYLCMKYIITGKEGTVVGKFTYLIETSSENLRTQYHKNVLLVNIAMKILDTSSLFGQPVLTTTEESQRSAIILSKLFVQLLTS